MVRAVLLGVAALLALAGCASGSSGSAGSDIAPLRSVEQFRALGVTLAPPADGATTAFTPEQIVAMCNRDATCPTDRSGAALSLASASTDAMSHINSDGSTTRTIDHRLVVAMKFSNAPCSADSPPGTSTVVPSPPDPHGCIWLVLVDAGSGQMLVTLTGGMPG